MSEVGKIIELFKTAMRRWTRASTASERVQAKREVDVAWNDLVSAVAKSETWTDDDHGDFDEFTREWNP